MSEATLLTAILAVQAETPTLRKDAENPHFRSKYTPLDTIVETVGPILAKHQLIWLTLPGVDVNGQACLTYRLVHAPTGDKIEGQMPLLLTKQDPQGFGSAITYARRYALCAVLNLVADDDDDGHAASSGRTYETPQQRNEPTPPQLKKLRALVTQHRLLDTEAGRATLLTMLANVGARDIDLEGKWTVSLSRRQVSGLLDQFNEPLPDPSAQDIPSDLPWSPGFSDELPIETPASE